MSTSQKSTWFQQEDVYPSIRRIWEPYVHRFFRGNIWLIEGRDADLVVDFGMGLASLKSVLGLSEGKPVIGLATHVHVDHVGSFHEFGERLGHYAEAEAFATMPDSRTLIEMFRSFPGPVAKLPYETWMPQDHVIPKAPLTRVLREDDTVELGDFSFRVLHLPGHSPGSIGLLEPRHRILVSGDAIYSGQLVDNIPGADVEAYIETMRFLACLDVKIVLGGHNAPISGDLMRVIAKEYVSQNSSSRSSE